MPAKKSLPRANVAVRSSHSFYIWFYCKFEQGVQITEIPRTGFLIHKSAQKVSSIKRRREDNAFPKLDLINRYHFLNFLWAATICNFVKYSHLSFVLTEGQRFFLDVKALVDSTFSKDVLLYGAVDHESFEFGCICRRGRLPFRRWYDLSE